MIQEDDETIDVIELEGNLSDVEKPPDIPPGRYIGEIQNVQINASQKGNRYFAVTFVIPSENLPANVREFYEDGAMLYWNRQLVPRNERDRRTLFNLKKFIEALGLNTNTTTLQPNDWMGQRAYLNVVMGSWQGENRPEIKSIHPVQQEAPSRVQQMPAQAAKRRR